jgi:hypothetical protein
LLKTSPPPIVARFPHGKDRSSMIVIRRIVKKKIVGPGKIDMGLDIPSYTPETFTRSLADPNQGSLM